MAPSRKKAATAPKKAAAASSGGPLLTGLADPAPFFSLGAAHFADAIAVTKVISVVLPLRHLRDRTILEEAVIKKLLHRPFEPSADDLAQQQEQHDGQRGTAHASSSSSSSGFSSLSPAGSAAEPYVIVHLKSVEVHPDTARQINPQGDVQVNVMATLVAAKVRHGLVAGVAEQSPFATCMQVRLPSVPVSAAVAAVEAKDALDVTAVASSTEPAEAAEPPSAGADCRQLRVTARCLEDEPVVPGQAVLLVSEPAAMRCLAVRPPRDAPGPFFFSEDVVILSAAAKAAAAAAKRRRAAKTSAVESGEGEQPQEEEKEEVGGRRVVVVACDAPLPEKSRKRPHS